MEIVDQLRLNGIDFVASGYEEESLFVEDVRAFMRSYEFMQLGQAINRKQWQAAGMKRDESSAWCGGGGICETGDFPKTVRFTNISHSRYILPRAE